MEGLVGSVLCQRVRSCWTRRRSWTSYQRLSAPSPTTPRWPRGVRLSRKRTTVLGSGAWRFGRLRRRAAASARWASPLQLLHRVVDAYVCSLLSQPLKALRADGVSSSPGVASPLSSSPTKQRRDASPGSSSRRRDAGAGGGRGVMLNICVAEALLLRRSTSEVRRSPLQLAREAARCASVRA
ncbi:hypothetical protein HU200_047597 [Digitaria exilis]|uniref:Uncharacterized protein n=1 Tax=Digitaria exilis TaxID=1010633 RepID=A0A835B8M2_9POAL|nr:hypothetical protein HU200_047597 [Digitaria exilis]